MLDGLEKRVVDLEIATAVLEAGNKKDIAALEKQIALQFTARDHALEIQHAELARRLDALNGEAGRLSKMQAEYVPREMWIANNKEINKEISDLKDYKNKSLGRQSVIAGLISVLVSSFWILVSFLWKR